MRILILGTKLPWPPRDGGSIATLNLARGLAQAGCRVTLLAMNTVKHHHPADQIPPHIRDLLNIRVVDVDTGIRKQSLVWNLIFSSYPYNAQRFISGEFRTELVNCLCNSEFDIIQLEGPYLEFYIPDIRKYSNAKIALRAHNLEHLIWKQISGLTKEWFKARYLANLAKRIERLESGLLERIDLLVPISNPDEKGFRKLGARLPSLVCYAGLDLSAYPENNPPDGIRLFFIGALDWSPNQQGLNWFFDEIWPRIKKEIPGMKFSLAGRNPSGYITTRKIPEGVILKGEVKDGIGFFNEHNVMIVPLLSGSGLRVKILEAMAMGKTVIATSTGASGINAIQGEHLYIADKPEEFIGVIRSLVNNPSLMKDMGAKARRFIIENFDNLALSKKLTAFYKDHLR